LTDGAVADEQGLLMLLRERLGQVRLHTIGLGNAPNSWLLRKMAQEGRGLHTFIATVDEARNRIDDFLERLDRPVLAGVRIDWEGMEPDSIEPRRLPDLYVGEPLVLSARLGAGAEPGRLVVGGYGRDGWVETELRAVDAAGDRPGLGFRWARVRVEAILDGLHEGLDEAVVRREVLELAFHHHLVTRYTSLVAVEERTTALGASQAVRAAAALPVGGTDGRRREWQGLALVALSGLLWWVLRKIR
jgi:Ca-activated chloride channel family protein